MVFSKRPFNGLWTSMAYVYYTLYTCIYLCMYIVIYHIIIYRCSNHNRAVVTTFALFHPVGSSWSPCRSFWYLTQGDFSWRWGEYDPKSWKSFFFLAVWFKKKGINVNNMLRHVHIIPNSIHGKIKIYRYFFDPRVSYVAHVDKEIYPPKNKHTPPEKPVIFQTIRLGWHG